MNRKRQFVILGVVLAALLAALLLIPAPAEEEEGGAEDSAYITLFRTGQVRAVTITPRDQSPFVLRYTAESAAELGDGQDCTLVGMEELPLSDSLIRSVLSQSGTLEAIEVVVESTGDIAQFGLDAPAAHVVVEDYSGGMFAFTIGNAAPVGDGYYARVAGDDAVYFVSNTVAQRYMGGALPYLSKVVTPGTYAQFERAAFGGTVREGLGGVVIANVTGEDGESTGDFALVEPVSRGLSSTDGATAVNAVFGMQALDVLGVYPTGEELEDYGLTEPYYATVRVESAELGDFAVFASAPDRNDLVYLMREGVPLLYVADASSLPWLDMQYHEFMDRTPMAVTIYDVEEVRVQGAGRAEVFALAVEDGEITVLHDGEPVDAEIFQNYYITLISAPQAEYTDELPAEDDEPVLTVRFTLTGGEVRTARYYAAEEARRYLYVYGDDDRAFYTPQMYVERAAADLERLLAGEYVLAYAG